MQTPLIALEYYLPYIYRITFETNVIISFLHNSFIYQRSFKTVMELFYCNTVTKCYVDKKKMFTLIQKLYPLTCK